jgi:hypothetical protein
MKKITLFLFAIIMASSFATAATGWLYDFLTIKVNGVSTANNYFLVDSDPASGATALNGKAFGTVAGLEITGCDMKYWADNGDVRTGGAFYYKIMSADGSTEVKPQVETLWDQTGPVVNVYQGIKATTLNILIGLPALN